MESHIRCAHCGQENSAREKRCRGCGRALPGSDAAGERSIGQAPTKRPSFAPRKPETRRTKPFKPAKPGAESLERLPYQTLTKEHAGQPYLAVLDAGDPPPGYVLRDPTAALGRGPGNTITIRDDRLSRSHALFAQIGRDMIVIDLGGKTGVEVNGRKVQQAVLQRGDVVDLGGVRLVFAAAPGAAPCWGYELRSLWASSSDAKPEGDGFSPPVRGEVEETRETDDEKPPDAGVVLEETRSGRRVVSMGRPALIGRDPNCHFKLTGEDVASFHAQLYWAPDGPRLRILADPPGALLDDKPLADSAVQTGALVRMGACELRVSFHGDVAALARTLSAPPRPRPLALTCVEGWMQGASATLPACDRPLVMGRSRECDLHVDDPRVSARHLSLQVGADAAAVEDMGSRNGIRINGEKVQKGTLRPGDLLSVGKSLFLLHRVL